MSRDDLLSDNFEIMQAGDGSGRQVLARTASSSLWPTRSTRWPGALQAERVSARARHRHGRRARLGADAHVHRHGAEGLGGERPRVRARRPRRHDGAAAALLDRRRHSDHRADGQATIDAIGKRTAEAARRSPSWSARAPGMRPARRRRRWSRHPKDKKKILPCSVFLQGEYGIRDLFVGVPVQARRAGHGADHRDQADARRRRRVQEVGGRGQGAGRRDQGLNVGDRAGMVMNPDCT